MSQFNSCSRREFLATLGAASFHCAVGATSADEPKSIHARPPRLSKQGRKPLAVLCTVYRPMSHAYHIAGRFIHGYVPRGSFHVPKHFVASLYADQFPKDDLAKETTRDFDIRLAPTIADALTLGTDRLAVDGVLLIAEHGDYPLNNKGQIEYPRFEFFEQVVSVFRKTGQSVPVFNDKHLSISWDKARKMCNWAQEMKFPLMAGSSLPVTWRRPELELPLESPVEDALMAAYGPIEVYGCHALEALQAMVERRKGGETGVKAVTCLVGDAVWKAGDEGRWSWDLLDAALARSETVNPGDIRRNVGPISVGARPKTPPIAFLVEYADGLRGTALLLNGHIQDFCFAAKLKGASKPVSCMFYLPMPPGARFFDGQVLAIERLLEDRASPYPVERTLLTTGILATGMECHHQGDKRLETPELTLRYRAPAVSGFMRGRIAAEP